MLNSDFFASDVEFVSSPHPRPRPRVRSVQRLALHFGPWSLAAVALLTVHPQSLAVTEARIVPSVILRSSPAPELTPEIVALYREAASEDRELAETGLADFNALIESSDET